MEFLKKTSRVAVEKTFKCEYCKKNFNKNSSMLRHQNTAKFCLVLQKENKKEPISMGTSTQKTDEKQEADKQDVELYKKIEDDIERKLNLQLQEVDHHLVVDIKKYFLEKEESNRETNVSFREDEIYKKILLENEKMTQNILKIEKMKKKWKKNKEKFRNLLDKKFINKNINNNIIILALKEKKTGEELDMILGNLIARFSPTKVGDNEKTIICLDFNLIKNAIGFRDTIPFVIDKMEN